MTLLVLSDSHGSTYALREAIGRARPDGILFAGDGARDLTHCDVSVPLWAVRGNCDLLLSSIIVDGRELSVPEEELITVDGVRILLLHGHTVDVKHGLANAVSHAAAREADVLVYGHTHKSVECWITPDDTAYGSLLKKPLLLFNPGSIGNGHSFGTLTVKNGQVLGSLSEL